jgi:hypothetical protein
MFTQMFAVFTMLFTALHQFMSALCNVATWTNEASGQFSDVSRHERNMAKQKMMEEAGITELPKADPVILATATTRTLTKAKAKVDPVDPNPIDLPA